jgi:hypothetical protein
VIALAEHERDEREKMELRQQLGESRRLPKKKRE